MSTAEIDEMTAFVIIFACGLWSLGSAVIIMILCIGSSRYSRSRSEEARPRPWLAHLREHWEKP